MNRKPNIKLMQLVHSESRIKKNSKILSILVDVDSFEYLTNAMIVAVRMAKDDVPNAEAHLCLATQLATIARTKIREDQMARDAAEQLQRQIAENERDKQLAESTRQTSAGYMDPLNHSG